jgi:Tfp pilus assembly protein PilO
MAKLPIVSWIENAAAVLVGGWGAVSRQAQVAGCSRQAAYDHAEKVQRAVQDAARGGATRDELRRQLLEKERQIAALEKRLAGATELPESEQQRFAATATAMGLSYAQAEELLGIVVKKNVPAGRRSRGG